MPEPAPAPGHEPHHFHAELKYAPGHGVYVCNRVKLEVTGHNLKNVELVDVADVNTKYITFSIHNDGTYAYAIFDPLTVTSNGPIDVEILAWNVPAGENGDTDVVMEHRRWFIANNTWPCVPKY